MKKRFRLIPFRFLPAAWGLGGQPREEAEANYYYTGRRLEEKLAEIRFSHDPSVLKEKLLHIAFSHKEISAFDRDISLLEIREIMNDVTVAAIELKHGLIDLYQHDKKIAETKADGPEKELALLEVEFTHGKIEKTQYEKSAATINQEPWIKIVNDGVDPNEGVTSGFFEFDWNDFFIAYLRLNGYIGLTDEDVVEQWFNDICRSQLKDSNVQKFPSIDDGIFRS